jgi:hypothetical protein
MTNRNHWMLAAAAFLATTAVASAQVMYAEIPFAFRAGAKVLAPGTYQVRMSGTVQNAVILSNFETRQSAILLSSGLADNSIEGKAPDNPVLGFDCSVGRCALIRLWTRSSNSSLAFPRHSLGRDEPRTVPPAMLVRVTGD